MKKTVLTLAAILLAVTAFAQKASLLVNRSEESGWRTVFTDYINCHGSGTARLSFSLGCSQSPDGERTYDLFVRAGQALAYEISYNSVMLIKFADDSVIELRNYKMKMRHRENALEPDSKVVEGYYRLTAEQLEALTGAGVSKIRIQTTEGYIEASYKKEKVSAALLAEYNLIDATLSVSADIREGF
ncbi:MAG: hypothetical protein LUC24_02515 [Bacteroidales bacterium]|nr:hypothetical protein [Bacteroidales bacterium]